LLKLNSFRQKKPQQGGNVNLAKNVIMNSLKLDEVLSGKMTIFFNYLLVILIGPFSNY